MEYKGEEDQSHKHVGIFHSCNQVEVAASPEGRSPHVENVPNTTHKRHCDNHDLKSSILRTLIT